VIPALPPHLVSQFHQMEVPIDSQPMAQSSFPQTREEFDSDPRVSFSKLDNKFILEVDDEHEYEYDDALKRWIPVVRPYPSETDGYLRALGGAAHPLHGW
jgi:hypothetical protein